MRALENQGVAVTVRDTRGREIDGACGQLATETQPSAFGNPIGEPAISSTGLTT